MLTFKEVKKVFKDGNQTIEAVQPTSLQLNKGELIAIVGPSGSGKSTFLTMAGALQTPTSGEIHINGQNITAMNQKQLASIRMNAVGFVLQSTNLVPFLTVKQQFQLLKKSKKNVLNQEEYQHLLEQLGLLELENKLPSMLSGGQKQRVAIAKALYTNPTIILADEPTASLDTQNALEVIQILQRQTKQRHKISIIVTHDERLTGYCDRIFHMEDGCLTEQ